MISGFPKIELLLTKIDVFIYQILTNKSQANLASTTNDVPDALGKLENTEYMSNIVADDTTIPKMMTATPSPQAPAANFADSPMARRMLRPARQPQKIGYEFTEDAGFLHQYYNLREEMFISVWGLTHFSGQKDQFDDTSEIMVARQGLQCIAGGRLTISTPNKPQPLPMERHGLILKDAFPELNLDKCSYGEFSRLAILPEFRGGEVFPEIARRFIKKAIASGVDYAFNMAPQPLARNYRQVVQLFGLTWDIRRDIDVPDQEEFEGIRMVVSVMDLTRFTRKPAATDTVAKNFLAEPALAD